MKPRDFGLDPTRFPRFEPVQSQALWDLSASFSRYDLIIAPTGSGKTVINRCATEFHGKRFLYLVSTKALEEQVITSFNDSHIIGIRGHRNYPCGVSRDDDSFECSRSKEGCDYRYRVGLCKSPQTIGVCTNYAHWINIQLSGDNDRLGKFDVIICDECHNLRDIVCNNVGFSLDDRFLSELAMGLPAGRFDDDEMMPDFLSQVARKIDGLSNPKHYQFKMSQKIRIYLKDCDKIRWVSERTTGGNGNGSNKGYGYGKGITFTPVWPMDYCLKFVFGNQSSDVKKIILSSATIHEKEMSRLGIPADDLSVIHVPSTFPASRRPIVYYNIPPRIQLRSSSTQSDKKFIINRLDTLTSAHQNLKGLIQCTSYDWMKQIISTSRAPEKFISHLNSKGLRRALDEYNNIVSGKFLISPSIKEGLDLPYDQCGIIFLPKVPFIDVSSALQSARHKEDKEYRITETARIVEQAFGRGMRRKDDKCIGYVLDGQWLWFSQSAPFTDHFKEAFRISSQPWRM